MVFSWANRENCLKAEENIRQLCTFFKLLAPWYAPGPAKKLYELILRLEPHTWDGGVLFLSLSLS